MEKSKRSYQQTARRARQEQTRARIVEALVALHEELGPKNTTISAVAERAGVQRLTVYRHFEDEAAMLRACSGHWAMENPPPNASVWSGIEDPEKRVRAALQAVHAYYSETEGMLAKVFRDASVVDALAPIVEGFEGHFNQLAEDAIQALSVGKPNDRLRSTARHLMHFSTWQSLSKEGLSVKGIVALGLAWLLAVR